MGDILTLREHGERMEVLHRPRLFGFFEGGVGRTSPDLGSGVGDTGTAIESPLLLSR